MSRNRAIRRFGMRHCRTNTVIPTKHRRRIVFRLQIVPRSTFLLIQEWVRYLAYVVVRKIPVFAGYNLYLSCILYQCRAIYRFRRVLCKPIMLDQGVPKSVRTNCRRQIVHPSIPLPTKCSFKGYWTAGTPYRSLSNNFRFLRAR